MPEPQPDRLTGLDVLAASMVDDQPAGEVPAADLEAPVIQVREPGPENISVELRWLDDGRLDVEYDPERVTEAARVFFDAVRRTFVQPDMVLAATPPAGADEVRAAIRTDEARGAIDGALGKLKADVSPDRRRFVADLIMDRVVESIIRERDEARQRAALAVQLQQETHDLADQSAKWEQTAMEQRRRAERLVGQVEARQADLAERDATIAELRRRPTEMVTDLRRAIGADQRDAWDTCIGIARDILTARDRLREENADMKRRLTSDRQFAEQAAVERERLAALDGTDGETR